MLCQQQAAVLSANLDHSVTQVTGNMRVNSWDKSTWRRHFTENMVIVCTAEVLVHCLAHSFVTIGEISLLIFDEAHHAKKGHGYAKYARMKLQKIIFYRLTNTESYVTSISQKLIQPRGHAFLARQPHPLIYPSKTLRLPESRRGNWRIFLMPKLQHLRTQMPCEHSYKDHRNLLPFMLLLASLSKRIYMGNCGWNTGT